MGLLKDHLDATHVRVTFHPQIWHHGRGVTSDETKIYLVPLKQALTPDGKLVADDTDGSDQLARVGDAPEITISSLRLSHSHIFLVENVQSSTTNRHTTTGR